MLGDLGQDTSSEQKCQMQKHYLKIKALGCVLLKTLH